jgi:hypothetical protein
MLLRRARRGALRKLGARFRRKPVLTEVAPSWPPVRHPFQVLMMAGCVWSGLFGMLGRGTPTSLARVLDFPVLFLWFAALVACGGLAVAAAITATRDQLWSMLLERLALFVVAGVVAGAWAGGFGLACLVRGAQVQQSLSWLRWNRHRVESLTP